MTRSTDCYVSLGARTRLANSMKADLFISIHCNAAVNS
ncbi:MAG: N-acetylmuramoyl-L-alanine amidase, partial [Candidatus Aegiribacteria sp.]|nr:N-acetylmuramoyl-L-alanine amidase [Candidatus Aegiribacteria sp.]